MSGKNIGAIDESMISACIEAIQNGNFYALGAVTAKAGGGQAAATQLQAFFNRVTVVATADDSVKLPAGQTVTVVTNASAASLNVFPPTGGVINAIAADGAYAIAAGKTAAFFQSTAGYWNTLLTA
jgi:hypothetical protein